MISCLSSEDGIKVYDGSDVHSPVMAHLCGVAHHAELWSSSSALLIEFYSSDVSQHTFEGFEARFQFLPAAELVDDDAEDDDDEEDDAERAHGGDDDDDDVPLQSLAPAATVTPATTPPTTARPTPTTAKRTRNAFLFFFYYF